MYRDYYGFSDKPFQLTPDPRFFFAAGCHQRALSYLRYGLTQAEGYIVVTGPVGSGKSTLARHLVSEVGEAPIVVAQLVSTNLLPGELLLLIAREFGVDAPNADKARLLEGLQVFLARLHRQGKRALLIVDEAQNLPAESLEELRMLSNFQVGSKPLLQSFLLGQEELRDIIDNPAMVQFRQRIIAQCHLEPLTVDEVQAYVEFRLRRVGWQGFPEFDAGIWSTIHRHTNGIPRRLNLFCDRLLLLGYLEERSRLDAAAAEAVAQDMEPPPPPRRDATRAHAAAPAMASAAAVVHPFSPEAVRNQPLPQPWPGLLQAVHYLDRAIEEKVRLLSYLDEQIAARQELLSAAAPVNTSDVEIPAPQVELGPQV